LHSAFLTANVQDFFGTIDEMRIWRVERSASEIAEDMDVYSSAKLAAHPDLVACWTFDEGEGRVVHDASGHGNDLVLTHEPRWCGAWALRSAEAAASRACVLSSASSVRQGDFHHRREEGGP
jgi:hypothetical protein